MEQNTKLALGVIAITAIAGAIALPAFAAGGDAAQGAGGQRGHQSASMMERGHADAMAGGNDMTQMTRMRGNMMGAQMQGQAGMMANMMGNMMNGAENGSMMKNN